MGMEKNRAVLYVRLSKEDADKVSRGDDSASIKNQRLLLTDYALTQGFKIIRIYSDDDESGLYDDRPGFEQMMLDAGQGGFDIILAKTQSRFSRNMEHIERYLHHDLPNLGIRFIGVADGVDTAREDNKKSRQINGLVNEWYCEDLSKNIRSAFRAKMKNGQFLGSSCPYGYRKDPKDHNHLVIDAYAAEVVRRIYKLYLSGYGKAKIGAVLSSEGILIPTLYKRQVLGENYYNARALDTTKGWSYQTIHTILNNETYIGNLIQNKVNTLSYKDKKKQKLPREQWIIVENTHEPIIEPEDFEMAQRMQKTRTRSVGAQNKTAADMGNAMGTEKYNLFSGMLYCGGCRRAMARKYARRGNRGFTGYVCRTYKTYGKKFCDSHSIDIDDLEKAVLCAIQKEAESILKPEDIDMLKQLRVSGEGNGCGCYEALRGNLQRRIDKTEKCIRKTYESYMEDLISKKEYAAYKAGYEEEIRQLQKQMEAAAEHIKRRRDADTDHKVWAAAFADHINVPELTRDMVLEFIHKIEVNGDGSVTIYYKFQDPRGKQLF